MKLLTLILYIAIASGLLTAFIGWLKKGHKAWLMTFLQNFTGILFLISGMVKAVDPLGTAYKMEQYFTEFQYTLQETAFGFMAPLFPFLSGISLFFSIVMIVYEILLGIMLIMGHKSKLTSWLFLLLVLFFTVLTGFTFLTGYVPSGVNFFEFSKWGPYAESNMRVTDCGCFGDFIKLVPRISFYKDLVLLVPAFYFVFKHRDMHQWFTARTRNIVVGVAGVLLIWFCLRNSVLDLPVVDFRPFKVGTDLYQKKQMEEEAMANVKVTLRLKNNKTGEELLLPQELYIKDWKKYPKEEWTTVEQIRGKPSIESTKVSEFAVVDMAGNDVAEEILSDSGDVFLIVAYTLKGETSIEKFMVPDTIWKPDTLVYKDSVIYYNNISAILSREESKEVYDWDPHYVSLYKDKVNPLMKDVKKYGAKIYAIAGGAGAEKLASFRQATGGTYDWYEADEILLKTIIRSNPGVVHLKAGKVVGMWHIRHLPRSLTLQ